ncbi:histidine--tRNA ligase [Caldisericum exile]|uniref:Histidine--tRNA ligase n=1 Tax=Caldisericum exile (strain DSM 21853 / NBRC 104410 / AZM16c01) TaxID=511051 RepID=A0A7U6JEV9_CALEA|nr:histidine--tRNA ligase [Caldisericum exile]BAL80868.1 histidyl-tRNA synthetase [Caldisericum exile AZM16c01]
MEIKTVKGFKDILGIDAILFNEIQKLSYNIANAFGYKLIVLPTVEYAELFDRSVGNTTDIVEKEMFTFDDKGGRTLSLRPEMTASVARSFIEHHMETNPMPLKFFYFGQCFRYENPQKGRYREFYQLGIEALGDISPILDVEVIQIALKIIEHFNIKNLKVKINSIGCRVCRPKYKETLTEALKPHYNELCSDCQRRLYTNPLRVLDCKKEKDSLKESLPKITDYLCDECMEHFEEVKKLLTELKIPFEVDNTLVRGLDYYTKTVFEVVSEDLGAQNALLGGGRYDYLIEDLGGRKTPGVGFALGVERFIEILKARNYKIPDNKKIYIAYDKKFSSTAFKIRDSLIPDFIVEIDPKGDSIKKQIERASRREINFVCILGEDEFSENSVSIKDMEKGNQIKVKIDELKESIKELINNA